VLKLLEIRQMLIATYYHMNHFVNVTLICEKDFDKMRCTFF